MKTRERECESWTQSRRGDRHASLFGHTALHALVSPRTTARIDIVGGDWLAKLETLASSFWALQTIQPIRGEKRLSHRNSHPCFPSRLIVATVGWSRAPAAAARDGTLSHHSDESALTDMDASCTLCKSSLPAASSFLASRRFLLPPPPHDSRQRRSTQLSRTDPGGLSS